MNEDRFRLKEENGTRYIFDSNRKKFVVLTAEEWVRQNILYYLMHTLGYPAAVISVEKQIKVGSRNRRYDIVVYKNSMPWLIVECKAESEVLNERVLHQLLAYNSTLQVAYLCITNGKQMMTYSIEKAIWENALPEYHI
jgi:hypothetical protein